MGEVAGVVPPATAVRSHSIGNTSLPLSRQRASVEPTTAVVAPDDAEEPAEDEFWLVSEESFDAADEEEEDELTRVESSEVDASRLW